MRKMTITFVIPILGDWSQNVICDGGSILGVQFCAKNFPLIWSPGTENFHLYSQNERKLNFES